MLRYYVKVGVHCERNLAVTSAEKDRPYLPYSRLTTFKFNLVLLVTEKALVITTNLTKPKFASDTTESTSIM